MNKDKTENAGCIFVDNRHFQSYLRKKANYLFIDNVNQFFFNHTIFSFELFFQSIHFLF